MSVESWLTEQGIEPDSVSDNLKGLLAVCDSNPEWAFRLRMLLLLEEAGESR